MAPRATPEEVAERIAIVADIMARGQWLGRITVRKLIDESPAFRGLCERTVQDYSRMASKLIYSDVEDAQVIRADTIAKMTVLAAKAAHAEKYRDAGYILAERAKVAGVMAPTRIEVDHKLPAWLPPSLAPLAPYLPPELDAPPTQAEWEHLAIEMLPEECTLITCRMHPRRGAG